MDVLSNLEILPSVRAFARGLCLQLPDPGLSDQELFAVELAVNEAVVNIIKHAYGGRQTEPIHLDGDVGSDSVLIRIRHRGTSFEPAGVPPPAFDGSKTHGFGLYIIKHSVDELSYETGADGWTTITMVKGKAKAQGGG